MTKLTSIIAGVVLLICAAAAVADTGIATSALERLIPFEADGTGTATTALTSSGVAKGDPFGVATYTNTFSVATDSSSTNGGGGFCVRGSGNVILTTVNGSVLYLEQVGLTCNTGVGFAGSNATFNGTFVINSTFSTGRFAGATGTGTVVTGAYGTNGTGLAFLKIEHIARSVKATAFVPDYRLAPEHPFPAAIEDATATLRGLAKRGIRRIAVTGTQRAAI